MTEFSKQKSGTKRRCEKIMERNARIELNISKNREFVEQSKIENLEIGNSLKIDYCKLKIILEIRLIRNF